MEENDNKRSAFKIGAFILFVIMGGFSGEIFGAVIGGVISLTVINFIWNLVFSKNSNAVNSHPTALKYFNEGWDTSQP